MLILLRNTQYWHRREKNRIAACLFYSKCSNHRRIFGVVGKFIIQIILIEFEIVYIDAMYHVLEIVRQLLFIILLIFHLMKIEKEFCRSIQLELMVPEVKMIHLLFIVVQN